MVNRKNMLSTLPREVFTWGFGV